MSSDYLKKPMLAKRMESIVRKGFTLTTCEMQGWRKTMEDASIFVWLNEEVYLFGVFDGHGGPQVAQYVAQMLPKQILNEPYFKLKNYPKALTNVFKRMDELLLSQRGEEELKIINKRLNGSPVANGEKISYRAGTTALVLLMTETSYFVANIGDSRGVLSSADATIALSKDHKPDLQIERERIQKAGGFVKQGRVNGSLNLSRSFGDFQYKHFSKMPYEQQVIISLPDIVEIARKPEDKFVLLGCDGVWQKYVNSNVKMVLHIEQLQSNLSGKTLMEKLFNDFVAKDPKAASGWDNMTALLIDFA